MGASGQDAGLALTGYTEAEGVGVPGFMYMKRVGLRPGGRFSFPHWLYVNACYRGWERVSMLFT